MLPQPVKILRQRKDKRSLAQCVMAEEAGNAKGDNDTSRPKSLVFHRLQPLTLQQRPSVFSRMGKDKTLMSFVFQRLEGSKHPKSSIFTKIKTGGKSLSSYAMQDGNSVCSHLGEVNEV